jgi:hypothetical protein
MFNSKTLYVVLMLVVLFSGAAYAMPKAVVEQNAYNAGDIPQGKPIVCEFTIKNSGDEPLTIKAGSCCGIKLWVPADSIEPGGQGLIRVNIATVQMRGMKLKKDIEVSTNDPEKKDIIFTVQATIVEDLVFIPVFVNFGLVKQGSNFIMEIVLSNNGQDPVTITQIQTSPSDMLSISPCQRFTLKQGAKQRFVLTFTPGKSPGIIEGSVLMKTDKPGIPEKNLSVRAEIVANR